MDIYNLGGAFTVIQCHSLSSLTVTILSCSLQLTPLDLSLSLSVSLPLLVDEPSLIDSKEDKQPQPTQQICRLDRIPEGRIFHV